jgi:hypothetical protein
MTVRHRVLVVPPGMTPDQATRALLAAATPGYAHSASCLLDTVGEHPDVDHDDVWSDDGRGMGGDAKRGAVSSFRQLIAP